MSIKAFIVKNVLRIKPGTQAATEPGELRVDSADSNKLKFYDGSTEDSVVFSTALSTTNTNLSNHLSDTTDAHDASAVSVVAGGNLAATDAQAALTELQGDIDTINTALGTKVDEITGTDNAIVRSNGTSGAIQDSDIQIDDNGHLLPEADGAQNLGSPTKRFLTAYVDTVTNDTDVLYLGDAAKTPTTYIDATTTISVATGNSAKTVNIATGSGANIVNIGGASTTINMTGTVNNQNVTNLNVTDKLITLNDGGAAASGGASGIEVEEDGSATGYVKVSSDRGDWEFKVPDANGVVSLTPGASNDSVVLAAATQTLTNKTFDADGTGNSISNIENADIKVGAAIARTKLATGTTNRLVVNDGTTGAMTDAAAITASRALASDANGIPVASATTAAELGYVSGVTSAIQTQLDGKVLKSTLGAKGSLITATAASTPYELAVGANGTFLKADSTATGGVAWASPSGVTLSVATKVNTDSPYTATTSDDILLLNTASGSITVNLPAAASSTGKVLRLIKTSASNTVTLDGNSSETIHGQATWVMYDNNETIEIACDGSNWRITAYPVMPSIELYLDAGNGAGAVDTKVRRFSNSRRNTLGQYATYADSANNACKVTVNIPGTYQIEYADNGNAGNDQIGITINSGGLTTSIGSITYANGKRTQSNGAGSSGYRCFCATQITLAANDVIRPQFSAVTGTDDGISFRVKLVSL